MTVKLVLRKVPKEPKKSYLFIRITKDRKSTYESLGFKITTKNLKKNGEAVTSQEPNHKAINKKIKQRLNHFRNLDSEDIVSPTMTKRHKVLPFMDKIINEWTRTEGTKRQRLSTRRKFAKYLESIDKEELTFSELTLRIIKGFHLFMDREREPQLSQNTKRTYLQVLNVFINHAKEDLKLPKEYNPFEDFKDLPDKIRPKNKSLTIKQLKLFKNKVWPKAKYNLYKDMFMFQVYGGGMRVSDVLTLRWKDFQVDDSIIIDYTMFKTKRGITSEIYEGVEFLKHCIARYYDDFSDKLQGYNDELAQKEKDLEQVLWELEEGLFSTEKEEEELILKKALNTSKIEILLKNKQSLYKESIKELSNNYPDQFVFPFMWDFENNRPFLDITVKITAEEEYKKIMNEKSKYNEHIKRMGEKLRIGVNISSHVARHTYTQLLLENNVNLHYLSMSLGHSSLKITEIYRRSLVNKDSISITKNLPQI